MVSYGPDVETSMLTSRDRFERLDSSPLQLRRFLRNKQHRQTLLQLANTLFKLIH